ncbi:MULTISPECIES: HEAT repeat domain-containing protein [unclassified Pseudomonas]|uniref:HEAT repeat domain-containing protein n=1 Tax=Pseudomonas TaxID=286 RepID=UPI0024B34CDF|nr:MULTISPECIES: HEAT repeat domain-containing protein [unclassified Pseudomonas]
MRPEDKNDIFQKFETWMGDSENSNWTAYSSELVAKVVLCDFAAEDWIKLAATVLSKAEYWQQRCIVSLGENRSPEAIEIMKLVLMDSSYIDARTIAIYELDWAEVAIESKYASAIIEIINSTPHEEVEPELKSLLAKSQASTD